MRRLLSEAMVVLLTGGLLSLVANAVSPRGLSLRRNYFPASNLPAKSPAQLPPVRSSAVPADASPGRSSPGAQPSSVAGRLKEKGLQSVDGEQAGAFFRDPRFEQERVIFIDARDDRHYEEGHIPGAFQFDRYYPEKHLAVVLPACLSAETVVVYCTGGDCEDSEFAAVALKEAGVGAERLLVYIGGITEWTSQGRPIETGARKSGVIRGGKP